MRSRVRRFAGALLASVLAVGLAGTGAAVAAPPAGQTSREALQQALDELAASGAAGVQIRVHDAAGEWIGTAGTRTLDGGEVPADGRFRVGSITKMFVATVALQLVDEGRVGLDDPIADYLPEFGIDERITVRMLLQHTSGVFNYTGDTNADGSFEPGLPLSGKEFEKIRFRSFQPEQLVELALSKPARFEPDTRWQYSNTNYILAGLLIEKVTGTPYEFQVWHRILAPLRLSDTLLPGNWPGIPRPYAHGYYAYPTDAGLRVLDVSMLNPSWGGAAGEMISTTEDLDTFLTALLAGELLPADLLAEMRTTRDTGQDGRGYGLGLQTIDAGADCGGVHEGHTGGIHGYHSYLFSTADGNERLAMSITVGDIDTEDPETGGRYFAAINKVVFTAFCGGPPPADTAAPRIHVGTRLPGV